ncbi:MAG: hypothetical protein QM811_04965 [Pirellulales bacterium]
MKFALLGQPYDLLPFVRVIAEEEPSHELSVVIPMSSEMGEIYRSDSNVALGDSWEALLAEGPTGQWDVLLLSQRATTTLEEQSLRKLPRSGRPIICAHPALDSMLSAYELEMTCRDGGARLIPWLPLRTHPLVATLSGWLREPFTSPVGKIERLTIRRDFASAQRSLVTAAFARDVDLIRVLVGDPATLLASGVGAADSMLFRTLAVDLTGESAVAVHWAAGDPDTNGDVLTLQGETGVVEWRIPTFDSRGECRVKSKGTETSVPAAAWSYDDAARKRCGASRPTRLPCPTGTRRPVRSKCWMRWSAV